MAYNALGCIICKEGEEHNVIEVALHDTRAQRRRMPNLNDLYRFSIASLGDRVSGISTSPSLLQNIIQGLIHGGTYVVCRYLRNPHPLSTFCQLIQSFVV